MHYNTITFTETEIFVRTSHEYVHVGQLTVFHHILNRSMSTIV